MGVVASYIVAKLRVAVRVSLFFKRKPTCVYSTVSLLGHIQKLVGDHPFCFKVGRAGGIFYFLFS